METEAIAEILGGRKVLGKAIKNPDDLAQLVRTGLPAGSVSALAERLHLGNGVLSRKLGIPQRTLTRRLSHGSLLTAAESDRTVRMARVYANAVEMIGDPDKAIEWLGTPNRALGGERPLDQLDTDMGARMWKTSWAALRMASTANAVLEDMPPPLCRRGRERRGCSPVWWPMEQPRSAHGLRLNFAVARRG